MDAWDFVEFVDLFANLGAKGGAVSKGVAGSKTTYLADSTSTSLSRYFLTGLTGSTGKNICYMKAQSA